MVSLYLPITSQPRELDSKLLLALCAAEHGLSPLIGYKSSLRFHVEGKAPGFYLAHNARQKAEKLRSVRQAGHRVIVLDEEALVRQSDEIFLKKHPTGALAQVDHMLCWGEDDRAMWVRSDTDYAGGYSLVGNPRMDLIRPEIASGVYAQDIASIRARFGDFVLLNTNFPTVNNLTPYGGGVRLAAWAMDAKGQEQSDAFLKNKRALFEAELALVRPLAQAIAPLTLVIRPHPNENHAPWHEAAAGLPNVQVAFEGGIVPWLLAARAIVHNGCTTAVEAAVAGTPVINFRPWQNEWDNPLAHAFGPDCADAAAVAVAIADLGSAAQRQSQADRLARYVASASGAYAGDRIAQSLLHEAGLPADATRPGLRDRLRARLGYAVTWTGRYLAWYCTRKGLRRGRFLRKAFPQVRPSSLDAEMLSYTPEQLELLMRQFPPLDGAQLNARIAHFAQAFGRFDGLQAHRINDYLFRIGR